MKRLLTILTAVALMLGAGTAAAQTMTWPLTTGGTATLEQGKMLTITGGSTGNYTSSNRPPWYPYREGIVAIVFSSSGGAVTIGDYAFADFGWIKGIMIPEGSNLSVGSYALANSGITNFLWDSDFLTLNSVGSYAFSGSLIEHIVFPKRSVGSSFSSVPASAFENCTELRTVVLAPYITSLSANAFRGCTALTTMVALSPSGVTLGSNCFLNVPNMNVFAHEDAAHTGDWARHTKIYIPYYSSCTAWGIMGDYTNFVWMLYGGTLNIFNFPQGLNPGSNELISNGSNWYSYLTQITSVNILCANGINNFTFGQNIFQDHTNLTSFTMPYQKTVSIGTRAFVNSGLTGINWNGATCNSFGSHAFQNTKFTTFSTWSITSSSINLPTGLFQNCTQLTSVTLPSNISSIYNDAFNGCSNLAFLKLERTASVVTLSNTSTAAFTGVHPSFCVGVPDNLLSTYQSNNRWGNLSIWSSPCFTACTAQGNITGGGTWKLCSGVLTISGNTTGSYTNVNLPPWYSYRSLITSVVFTGTSGSSYTIGNYAFYNCTNLTSITCPASKTSLTIGSYAFQYSNLASFSFNGSTATSIGTYAFANTKLSSVSWTNSNVSSGMSLPASIFQNCTSLNAVSLPSNITSIGNYAFQNCTVLNSVSLPSNLLSIGSSAFQNCINLPSLTLPNSVNSIGTYAFQSCSSLTSIAIPNNITSIANYAFADCSSLTSVSLPSNLQSIGSYAFYNCRMTSLTLPNSVESIGTYAFQNCTALTSIAIPNNVASIGAYAFISCSNLNSVTIGSGVTAINNYTFSGCSSLASVTLPANVASIGQYAFNNCTALTSLILERTINTVSLPNVNAFNNVPLGFCVIVPPTLLGNYMLASDWQTFLQNFNCLGDSFTVTLLGMGGTPVSQQQSVVPGGKLAEPATPVREGYTLEGWYDNSSYNGNPWNFENNTVNSSFTLYAKWSGGCSVVAHGVAGTLGWVLCADSTLALAGEGIMPDYSISSMPWYTHRNRIARVEVGSGILGVGANAFYYHAKLREVSLPGSITNIGDYAFEGCTALTNIALPGTLSGLGVAAFSSSGLTSITLPGSVSTVSNYAFAACASLAQINLSDGVAVIGSNAFYECTALDTVDLPGSITEVRMEAFQNCSGLKFVRLLCDTVPVLEANAFSGVHYDFCVLVPADLEEAYSATAWAPLLCSEACPRVTFNSMGGSPVPSMLLKSDGLVPRPTPDPTHAGHTFAGWYKDEWFITQWDFDLDTVIVHDTLYARWSGSDCTPNSFTATGNLSNMSWSLCNGTLTVSGSGDMLSFAVGTQPWYGYLAEITRVVIGEGITSIGRNAFNGGVGIEEVSLPSTLATIGISAFQGCTALTWITLPELLNSIGNDAFNGCSSLISIEVLNLNPPQLGGAQVFLGVNPSCCIHVPPAAVDAYRKASRWNEWLCTESNIHDVTFDVLGGSPAPSAQQVHHLQTAADPGNPTRAGYTFLGWSTNLAGWKETAPLNPEIPIISWDFNDPVLTTMTLYARWVLNRYPVAFNAFGGILVDTLIAPHGKKIDPPAEPLKLGFAFGGWYRDNACTAAWSFGSATIVRDTTLYAKWTTAQHSVTFDVLGGTPVPAQNIPHGGLVNSPADPTRDQHVFEGWYADTCDLWAWRFDSCTITQPTVLYAKWTLCVYPVVFNVRGGSPVPDMQHVMHGYPAEEPNPAPELQGYDLYGWVTDTIYNTLWNFANDRVTAPLTLYALWLTAAPRTVTFEPRNGSSPSQSVVEYGTPVVRPSPDPVRYGYIFEGWFAAADTFLWTALWDFNTPIENNTVLCAKWSPKPYTVTFNSMDGSAVPSQSVPFGEKAALPIPDPTRYGYNFNGWFADTTGWHNNTALLWSFEDNPITADITLHARWLPKPHTVTFDARGGSAVPAQNVPFGEKATEPTSTLNGYGLVGWYADSTYSTEWSFNTPITSDTTLYAKWVLDSSEHQCEKGIKFTLSVPIRLSPADTITYRWYRNGVPINGGAPDSIAVYDNSKVICTIPASEAKGINVVFHFDYKLNDGCNEWTLSPRKYTISFMLPQ